MAYYKKSDLLYNYSWKTIANDDPSKRGLPDSLFLNRNEGYEVLDFINRIAEEYQWTNKAFGHKLEWLLFSVIPSNIRSFKKIHDWLKLNWDKY